MIEVKKHGVILEKTTLGFENAGVLNPAAIRDGEEVHLYYRAVKAGNFSSIGYCKMQGPLIEKERWDMPIIFPQLEHESHGIEDPRITKIDDLYYLTYTAYDGINALGALATSSDLLNFEKQGIIVPQFTYHDFKHLTGTRDAINIKYARYNDRSRSRKTHLSDKKVLVWDKNVIFFPRRINGMLYFLHRIKPDIQTTSVKDLKELTREFWEDYLMHLKDNIALSPKYDHEVCYIGGGCPPIETAEGWLLIYHGVHDTPKGYVYSTCAALMDLEHPQREIARLSYPLFKPERSWELKGEVNNVCFPSGAVVFDDELYIYYGAADERIACASVSLSALISELLLNAKENEK